MECREIVDSVKAENRHENWDTGGILLRMWGGGGLQIRSITDRIRNNPLKNTPDPISEFSSVCLALELCFLLDTVSKELA